MVEAESALQQGRRHVAEHASEIWVNLRKNNLWKRIVKNVITTTLLVSICLIPGSKKAIGKAAYLGAIVTVFAHPGRRFGQMTEALILTVSGTVIGVAWSTFGIYLGSLVIKDNPPAAYAIRGFFLAVVALIHGFLRSHTPRLFIFVLLMLIVAVVSLTSTAKGVTPVSATQILYPILIAAGCITLINLCIFPEFSSRFLGQMTIDTLNDTARALENAGRFFVEEESSNSQAKEPADRSPEKGSESDSTSRVEGSGEREVPLQDVSVYRRFVTSIRFHAIFPHNMQRHGNESLAKSTPPQPSMKELTDSKAQIRKKLADCKAAQQECNFELAVSVLPPRDLKPLSVTAMKKLVANTIAVISACESKFALIGGNDEIETTTESEDKPELARTGEDSHPDSSARLLQPSGHFGTTKMIDEDPKERNSSAMLDQDKAELHMIKPKREIEFGDARLLRYLLRRVAKPYETLHQVAARAVEVVIACVAHAYDVPTLPSGAQVPKGIIVEELDLHLDGIQQALLQFDSDAASALEGAATMQALEGLEPDIMPREEVFLISSFMLNVRQAVTHIEDMLKHSRELVLYRQQRRGRRRIYAPRIKWSKWLYTGGTEDEALPTPARKANREGNAKDVEDDEDDVSSLGSKGPSGQKKDKEDVEKNAEFGDPHGDSRKDATTKSKMPASKKIGSANKELSSMLRLRGYAADALEWTQNSEDVLYAMKLGFALFLVLWPAFISSWNTWYSLNRGLWAALQLVLITEVSIGNSVMVFLLRAVGTTLGCLWGYAALEAHNGNRIVCAVMIFVGLFPCVYVQLGTKYPKAGMVCIVSICVVSLANELQTVPGTATEDFLKRWIAFIIGGSAALLVQVAILPVKARTRVTDSLSTALRQINEMERCIAFGIESGKEININAPGNFPRFEQASSKANTAVTAAETFLPFCSTEPRIKGSFQGLALIYGEILFVLHQIVDRMDNMLQLRTAYGSGPLEDLNAEIYPYRRNVAGSITLTLFAIHSALTTKLPLPQYIPSARLAHLRMINRVREVVLQKVAEGQESHDMIAKLARRRAVRRKYMSWNAASAAQAEIIEFLEELVDLTKLLVGANEFRSGLLTRPTFREYVGGGGKEGDEASGEGRDEVGDAALGNVLSPKQTRESTQSGKAAVEGLTRRRRGTTANSKAVEDDVPASLRRIQSRKMEAGLKKQRTNES